MDSHFGNHRGKTSSLSHMAPNTLACRRPTGSASTVSRRSSGFHRVSSHDGIERDTAMRPSIEATLNVTRRNRTSLPAGHQSQVHSREVQAATPPYSHQPAWPIRAGASPGGRHLPGAAGSWQEARARVDVARQLLRMLASKNGGHLRSSGLPSHSGQYPVPCPAAGRRPA